MHARCPTQRLVRLVRKRPDGVRSDSSTLCAGNADPVIRSIDYTGFSDTSRATISMAHDIGGLTVSLEVRSHYFPLQMPL